MAKYGFVILLLVEMVAAFWPLPREISVKNNLAAWPRSQTAKESAEALLSAPGRIREEIAAWEAFLNETAETRNGLIKLALLHWQIYDEETAKTYWQRAAYLDPPLVSSLPRPRGL